MVARVAPQAAVITASPPTAAAWWVAVLGDRRPVLTPGRR
jgi:hypothetical protein